MNRLPCLAMVCACAAFSAIAAAAPPTYDVYSIRYGGLKDVPVNALVPKADPARKIDTAFMVWLIRGQGRNILVDAGFHRDQFIRQWHPVDYVEPSKAIARLGLKPEDITDIIITHLHWDHADGIDLFPNAHIWIQKDELAHYANEAAQHPNNAGVFAEDVAVLVALEKRGRVTRIDGDTQAIFTGITAYIGGKHTFQSQFIGVHTATGTIVLASDNVYLYENIDKHLPITATSDAAANLRAQDRMKRMVTDPKFIIPGHDGKVMTIFAGPIAGVAKIQ